MPVYEYYCDGCQHRYETIRSVSRMDEPAPCPRCGEPGHRQLSAFGFKDGRYGRFWRAGAPTGSSPKPEEGPTE